MEQTQGNAGKEQANKWAVVLAAGEGKRLHPVTRLLYGHDLPKQFAALNSEHTLLQQTIARISALVRRDHTLVVVAEEREALAKAQLARFPGVEIIPQPANLGTGPGILLPLSVIKSRSAEAEVLVTPSDHVIANNFPFLLATHQALRAAKGAPSGLAVVGAEADKPASDLGWIVPQGRGRWDASDVDRVELFVEKPSLAVARALLQRGGLWNTLIVAGTVDSFWAQAQRYMPHQAMLFNSYAQLLAQGEGAGANRGLLNEVYESIPSADFSRAVLQKLGGMAVVRMRNSGWTDCGTPERLLTSLSKATDLRPPWLQAVRLAAQAQLRGTLSLDHGV